MTRINNLFEFWVAHTEAAIPRVQGRERKVLRTRTCYGVKNYLIDVDIVDKRKSVNAELTLHLSGWHRMP